MDEYTVPLRRADGCIPTLNNKGVQMATPSPQIGAWLHSYDGKNPLMDLGCAYGINTYQALNSDIPTIALDMEIKHLELLKRNADTEKVHLLTPVVGSLPYDIPVPDCSVSGILLSEVVHFLRGDEIYPSLATVFRKLIPGGSLFLSTASIHAFDGIDDEIVNQFLKNSSNRIKWPGVISDIEYIFKDSKLDSNDFKKPWRPEFLHFFVPSQIEEQLHNAGFDIKIFKGMSAPRVPRTVSRKASS